MPSDLCLAVYIDGFMQSWGVASRFKRRTTLSYPTRSGLTGILAAALGLARDDRAGLAELASLELTVMAFGSPGQHATRWRDYHTVGGGYEHKGKQERSFMPRKAEGNSPDTVLTGRDYLAQARFGALFTGDAALVTRCANALTNPVWGCWLGRKCCIPSAPLLQGVYPDAASAQSALVAADRRHHPAGGLIVRQVLEAADFCDGTDTLPDLPLDFAERIYLPRRITDNPGAIDGNL